jgi:hypothetical protein
MDLSFLNNLRKITNEDERLVTITLLIDVISNLINDRNNHRHHTLPANYIQEMFQKYSGAMNCLNQIGFKQVRYRKSFRYRCRSYIISIGKISIWLNK